MTADRRSTSCVLFDEAAMEPILRCPDPTRLQQHLTDTLPPSDEVNLVSHLDTCVACQQTLQSLVIESGRLLETAARVGEAGSTAPTISPSLRGVLDRLTHDDCRAGAVDAGAWR